MTTLSLGPFAIPLAPLPWLVAVMVASLVAARRKRRGHPGDAEPLIIWLAAAALIGARAAFVLRYQDQFTSVLAMFDLRDGGLWWPGALAGLAAGMALAAWRRAAVGEALHASLYGALAAVPVAAVVVLLNPAGTPAPDVTLYRPDGGGVSLHQARGPGVTLVNLWATWCPPCRREMPVLEAGQHHYPRVRFLFANQGEDAATMAAYLSDADLELNGVYLDPHGDLARAWGSGALPTTVLLNGAGEVIDHHIGPLSAAGLQQFLQPHLKE